MATRAPPPQGPRGVIGARAEEAVAQHLDDQGWIILARNLRVGRDEVDIVAVEPGDPNELVIVEVRSSSSPRFGSPAESVTPGKVARLYRAALALGRQHFPGLGLAVDAPACRVDLITMHGRAGGWVVETHLRGLEP